MLYDNALLLDLMTEVWRETASPLLKTRIAETVAWLEREMIAEGGGFAASLDADSEGEEGKFYVWTFAEIIDALGSEDGQFFAQAYDVTPGGNWEGHAILNRLADLKLGSDADEARLGGLRTKLLEVRAKRVRPGWDDKVLADWNGLMIAALARASVIFDEPRWLELAERAFDFVAKHMTIDGRLMHSWRDGRAKAPATASDYANMICGALRLYEATKQRRFIEAAAAWVDVLDRHYWLAEGGGYTTSADDTSDVIVRLRPGSDDATPNANGVMVSNLSELAALTGEGRFAKRAGEILAAFAGEVGRNIVAHTGLLAAAIDYFSPQQVVIAGRDLPGGEKLMAAIRTTSLPGAALFALNGDETVALAALSGKQAVNSQATGYLCLGAQCSLPLTDSAEFAKSLRTQRSI